MLIYDFSVKNSNWEDTSLSNYKGKVLLIINSATQSGFTPQYGALEELYKKYCNKGFEILDFPCNQFINSAPENNDEITKFCTLNYGTTFSRFAKIDVNGKKASKLFKWLKKQAPNDKMDHINEQLEEAETMNLIYPLERINDIKWTFTKFLIDKTGNVYERYYPKYDLELIKADIEKLL